MRIPCYTPVVLALRPLSDKHSPRPLPPRPLSPRLLPPLLTASRALWECLRLPRTTQDRRSIRTLPRTPEVSRSTSYLQTTPDCSVYDLSRRHCCGRRHLHPYLRDDKYLGQRTCRNRPSLQLMAGSGWHQHRRARGQRCLPAVDPSAQMVRDGVWGMRSGRGWCMAGVGVRRHIHVAVRATARFSHGHSGRFYPTSRMLYIHYS